MAEEITANAENEQDVQTTEPVGDVDTDALYNKEKKYSQSMRSRAQKAETELEKLRLESEDYRQDKLIAEGKKDDVIAELKEKVKAQESELNKHREVAKKERTALLEDIPEEEKAHYEKMDLETLRHFVAKEQPPEVSNPGQAVQGRTATDLTVDSFMKESENFKRDNFSDMVRKYDNNSSKKVKVK